MGHERRRDRRHDTTTPDSTGGPRGRRRPRDPFDDGGTTRGGGRGRPGPRSGGRRGRGGGRARRGEVRAALLALLGERPMHGYEMIGELSDRTSGMWNPSPGSVYPTLQLLEDEGLVSVEDVDGKRRFSLTDAGRERVEAATGPAPWERFEGNAAEAALAEAVQSVVEAARQVRSVGTAEQQERATEALVEVRRALYEVLAAG